MTVLGIIGILLGLACYKLAVAGENSQKNVILFLCAWVTHLATTFVYYQWVQSMPADTYMYYYDPWNFYYKGFQLNTWIILAFVQFIKEHFGGTYLDFFLLFQAIGFWGIALLLRTINEIYRGIGAKPALWIYIILFLPGLHFWSSAIGKDAVLLFATVLVMWAVLKIEKRLLALAAALVLMLLIRPHIALVAVTALAVTAMVDRTTNKLFRAALFVVGIGGVVLAVTTIERTMFVNVASAESLGDFLAARTEASRGDAGGSAVHASYPVRVLSLLFRPFFFDVDQYVGWIASVENLFMVSVVTTLIIRIRTTALLVRRVFSMRFALLFAVALTLLLGYMYYNVGLGLRQRLMIQPALFALFTAVLAAVEARRATSGMLPERRAREVRHARTIRT